MCPAGSETDKRYPRGLLHQCGATHILHQSDLKQSASFAVQVVSILLDPERNSTNPEQFRDALAECNTKVFADMKLCESMTIEYLGWDTVGRGIRTRIWGFLGDRRHWRAIRGNSATPSPSATRVIETQDSVLCVVRSPCLGGAGGHSAVPDHWGSKMDGRKTFLISDVVSGDILRVC